MLALSDRRGKRMEIQTYFEQSEKCLTEEHEVFDGEESFLFGYFRKTLFAHEIEKFMISYVHTFSTRISS